MDLDGLSFPSLSGARAAVGAALAEVSGWPSAPEVLGVSAGLLDGIAANLVLGSAPAVPVGELYSGVLYDALDLAGLDPVSQARARRRVVVISALYGALRLTDKVAPYRLAMGASLPQLGRLAPFWRPLLVPALVAAAGSGVVVDMRSAPYVAAAPAPADLAHRWVHVRVPGASHGAKHTRGLVARALCGIPSAPRTVPAVAKALEADFDVTLAPSEGGRPTWVIDVTLRADVHPVAGGAATSGTRARR